MFTFYVDVDVFEKARGYSVKERISIGQAINRALLDFFSEGE